VTDTLSLHDALPISDLNLETIFEKPVILHLCRKCKKKTIICEK
jgi:hypothetical protein